MDVPAAGFRPDIEDAFELQQFPFAIAPPLAPLDDHLFIDPFDAEYRDYARNFDGVLETDHLNPLTATGIPLPLSPDKVIGEYDDDTPSWLIPLSYPPRSTNMAEMWNIWTNTPGLRNPDANHALILQLNKNVKTPAFLHLPKDFHTWRGKWILAYSYYQTIGSEIDRKLLTPGTSEESAIKELEIVREALDIPSIKQLCIALQPKPKEDTETATTELTATQGVQRNMNNSMRS